MNNNIKIIKENNEKTNEYIAFNLHQYNINNCEYIKTNSTIKHNNKLRANFTVYEDDKIIGGIIGWIKYGWYYLDEFYIEENHRNQGIGSKLISIVEEFAKANNCLGVRVDTWDFQAPNFYQKLGYQICSVFEDCPPGTKTYYLYKKF